ncbi:hypothetical protein C8N25_102119 [Algoriphagus antarcticus]|uniref:Uncharacterized protein n=1 Tax=Algoriphagus antarcticus TaxID=238540 RepID=A0A3E0E3B8_9BACT|nr:hypothetical protein C8N25_102119 [Algoriphagus antarcticus]
MSKLNISLVNIGIITFVVIFFNLIEVGKLKRHNSDIPQNELLVEFCRH